MIGIQNLSSSEKYGNPDLESKIHSVESRIQDRLSCLYDNLLDIPIPFIQISTSTEWQFNVYEFLERWIHALIAELSDWFCRFPVVMFVHILRGWTTLTWRLQTNFHKFGCIVSPNVSRMKNCAGLNLSLDIHTFTFFHIHDSGLYLMNGFNF